MKYLKLILPILIGILLTILEEQYLQGHNLLTKVIIKGGIIIYYLRLDNSRTPLINTLTCIIIVMMVGEYLLPISPSAGHATFIVSYFALGLIYFFRQKLKDKKDNLSKLKIAAVSIFVLTNILQIGLNASFIFVAVGAFLLASVYFYDRLIFKP